MLIFIHIPKTAGSALRGFFQACYGDAVMEDYGSEMSLETAANVPPGFENEVNRIQASFDMIIGHFHFKKYFRKFPGANVGTCLRDPVKRIASQYAHMSRIRPDEPGFNHRCGLIQTGKMSIVDLVEDNPNAANAISLFLDGAASSDFNFVLFQDCLEQCLTKLPQLIHDPLIRRQIVRSRGKLLKKNQ